jgi:hypothetical protein
MTPKHASWMNQVEIWLSIVVRKLLRRGTFRSVNDLRTQVLAFIDYFNQKMAKPFKWTYQSKPPAACLTHLSPARSRPGCTRACRSTSTFSQELRQTSLKITVTYCAAPGGMFQV